jgi:hypothetical protein
MANIQRDRESKGASSDFILEKKDDATRRDATSYFLNRVNVQCLLRQQ